MGGMGRGQRPQSFFGIKSNTKQKHILGVRPDHCQKFIFRCPVQVKEVVQYKLKKFQNCIFITLGPHPGPGPPCFHHTLVPTVCPEWEETESKGSPVHPHLPRGPSWSRGESRGVGQEEGLGLSTLLIDTPSPVLRETESPCRDWDEGNEPESFHGAREDGRDPAGPRRHRSTSPMTVDPGTTRLQGTPPGSGHTRDDPTAVGPTSSRQDRGHRGYRSSRPRERVGSSTTPDPVEDGMFGRHSLYPYREGRTTVENLNCAMSLLCVGSQGRVGTEVPQVQGRQE